MLILLSALCKHSRHVCHQSEADVYLHFFFFFFTKIFLLHSEPIFLQSVVHPLLQQRELFFYIPWPSCLPEPPCLRAYEQAAVGGINKSLINTPLLQEYRKIKRLRETRGGITRRPPLPHLLPQPRARQLVVLEACARIGDDPSEPCSCAGCSSWSGWAGWAQWSAATLQTEAPRCTTWNLKHGAALFKLLGWSWMMVCLFVFVYTVDNSPIWTAGTESTSLSHRGLISKFSFLSRSPAGWTELQK